jgi:hypothetical protein
MEYLGQVAAGDHNFCLHYDGIGWFVLSPFRLGRTVRLKFD